MRFPHFYLVAVFACFSLASTAQRPSAGPFVCGQQEIHNQQQRQNAGYRLRQEAVEWAIERERLNGHRGGLRNSHTLPVVFHIIHNGGAENITDAQVAEGLQHLNSAFANTGYYDPSTGTAVGIDFCLASRRPDNTASTGIERVVSELTQFNYLEDDQTVKDLSRYDPNFYINIWVVDEICSNNGCGVAGYAYLPGAHGQSFDGIVVEADYVGSSPAASAVLVHEMGHYLGLYHTFEGGCSNADCQSSGDRVCDTPPDNTTARPPCGFGQNSCTTDTDDLSANNPFRPVAQGGLGDQPDAHENYMDYSRLECYNQFSAGQAARMLAVVETIRSSLLSSLGCADPCPVEVEAAFSLNATSFAPGQILMATNNSSNADGYEWYINGDLVSTDDNLSYPLNQPGIFTVELLALSDDALCTNASAQQPVEVACAVEADFSPQSATLQPGGTVAFDYNTQNAEDYEWRVNGVVVSTDADYEFQAVEPGVYTICLIAGDDYCEDEVCSTVQVINTVVADSCAPTFALRMDLPGGSTDLRAVLRSGDGNIYAAGGVGGDALIVKVTPEGDLLWARRFDFTDRPDKILSFHRDDEGMLYGVSYASAVGAPPLERGAVAFRYDVENDDMLWVNYFNDHGRFHRISVNPLTGNYLAYGVYIRPVGVNDDAELVELDRNTGTVLWNREFHTGSSDYFADVVYRGQQMLISGRSTFSGSTGGMRPTLYSFDLDGNLDWSRFYLTPATQTARQYADAIELTGDGAVFTYFGPESSTNLDLSVSGLIKTTFEGEPIWRKKYDLQGFDYLRLSDILSLTDGFLLYGFGGGSGGIRIVLIRTDLEGNALWCRSYESGTSFPHLSNVGGARLMVMNGFYYLAGALGDDALLLKVRPDGGFNGEIPCPLYQEVEITTLEDNSPYVGDNNMQEIEGDIYAPPAFPGNSQEAVLEATMVCATPACDTLYDNCTPTFVSRFGSPELADGAIVIAADGDGRIYLGGYSGPAAMIAQYTEEGALMWQRQFDFSEAEDRIHSLTLDNEGHLVGVAQGLNPPGVDTRIGVAFKYDPASNTLLWTQRLGGRCIPKYGMVHPLNGNFLVAGSVETEGGLSNALLLELEPDDGSILWERQLQRGNSATYNALAFANNTLYATGRYEFPVGFDKMRVISAAFETDGSDRWQQRYLYPIGAIARQYAQDIAVASDGLVFSYVGSLGTIDFANQGHCGLYKTDYGGTVQWAKYYESPDYSALLAGYSLAQVSDGYLLFGNGRSSNQDMVLIKTDFDGNALWAKAYGLPGIDDVELGGGAGVRLLQQGNAIYFVGATQNGSSQDALLVRTDLNGEVLGGSCDYVRDIAITTQLITNPDAGEAAHQEVLDNLAPEAIAPPISVADTSWSFLCAPPDCPDPCLLDFTVQVSDPQCRDGQLLLQVEVCNARPEGFTGSIPVTVYDAHPGQEAANPVDTLWVEAEGIADSSCAGTEVLLPVPEGILYFQVNDDGSFSTPFDPVEALATLTPECDYLNNLDSLFFTPEPPQPDLGPDYTVCENSAIVLNAGGGFSSYRWADGSMDSVYTAYEPGTYWVEVTDECGISASDTINVSMSDPVMIDIQPQVAFICPEDSAQISLAIDGDYTVEWHPDSGLSCSDCTELVVAPDTTTSYTVVATNADGCISTDSVQVNLIPCEQVIETSLCANDSLLLFGKYFYPARPDTVMVEDTLFLVEVEPIDTILRFVDTLVCFGDSAVFDGITIPGGEQEAFVYSLGSGCDSTVVVRVEERPRIVDTTFLQICEGDSALVFGQPAYASGLYSEQFTALSGCDSTHYIQLAVLDTPTVSVGQALLSCRDTTSQLEAEGQGGQLPYGFQWSNGITGSVNSGLAPGTYSLTITDANGCRSAATGEVLDALPVLSFTLSADSVSCFGFTDGSITAGPVSGGTPPYTYSLDGVNYQSEPVFPGLEAGGYTLHVQDSEGCRNTLMGEVGAPLPLSLLLPADTALVLGESLPIDAQYAGNPWFFSWNPPEGLDCADCPMPTATPLQTTRYFLTISTSPGCSLTDDILIFIEKPRRLYIPNAFSPNGDGVNDFFRLYAGPDVERILRLRIFDRWGELIFEEENYAPDERQPAWDGRFRGEAMQPAVFAYVVEALFIDGEVIQFSGDLQLLR